MDALVLAAATALVTAMTTDGWQQARSAIVSLWRRHRPDHAPAIEADVDATHAELVAAREAGSTAAADELVADWKRRLRRLLESDPALEAELRRVLDEELMPVLPPSDQARVQNIQHITASAPGAVAQGVMYGNIINHGTPRAADSPLPPAGGSTG
jgi:hypothetical protein